MKPKFEGIDSVYKSKADNKDIRDLLERLVPKAKAQMVEFSQQFKGRTEQETCKKIFDYLKNNFTYVADGEEQIIKLPSALLAKKVGDCKSYSLFTSGILENLGIPYHFVYASYTTNPIPGHVYVTTDKGCIIDAVYGIFNQEKKPNYKYKKNMNVRYMAGICTDCVNPEAVGLGNRAARKEKRQDRKEARQEKREDRKEARQEKRENKPKGRGKQRVKTIGLAPGRNLFLLLVKNNLDGIASKMAQGDQTAFLNKWYELGGNRTTLAKNIKIGASKRERKLGFLNRIKKVVGNTKINGIGQAEIPESIKAGIVAACAAAGTAIAGPKGTAAGTTMGTVVVELLPTLMSVLNRTPVGDDTITTTTDIDTTTEDNEEGAGPGMNMKTILPIVAILAAGGIYLATRKK
jgi:hypothetical protein